MSYMVSEIMGGEIDDTNSDLSDARFLTKGAFLLTPSHDLSLDKAANICDKLNFKGSFSLTKTATGILFKFSEPEDYQQVYRKGFHKVTGGRLYRKVAIPCRPQKTFSLLVNEVPLDLPEDDIRASLFRYTSVVEVIRVPPKVDQIPGTPNPIRITVASLDEYNNLLQQGLDFYGATYFPTEPFKKDSIRGSKEIMPVFDAAGFSRIPPPASRLLKPRSN
ncbi:soluble nsf attachment protein snap [Holotrichia oblita]|uniref:Soluble nsf attachment protein snap n=2 Tax=Holotrichia oblita TaxID=644536 RepID=A0ACB9SL44_HOLOL|nr:soluble nsf attachment protein snap [Holotrichia oblita]KAI4454714.1 soluble nsf attachment protein snap [Holotrichia oblita]